ncbi:protein ORF49 [Cyprinid herpesvirus 3]|uniref:ORF49R n=1 Tax=Cyprinid herpesvirus 3 TaxID=180230 RepID=A3QML7_CYHV3|nr:unnamed protein product [Cyprinid herpesvirus 3]ABC55195.1 hypothetical protein [Cyprinid herpesvirus 3]ABG42876.1 protein ORF49 [Cyprinid herpesvirus 3]AIC32404.1 ORF49R [Cyprinid herpesvirus 3]AJP55538.1 protein ORF49 [Cyprinid herpesvirus 3]AJP55695.1 protein ORF49 [Cyprinid herpesvirus 3]
MQCYPVPKCYDGEPACGPSLRETLMRAVRQCPRNQTQPCLTWKLENGSTFMSVTRWEETCAQVLRFVRGCALHRLSPPDNLGALIAWLLDQARLIPSNHHALTYVGTLHGCMLKFSAFMDNKPRLQGIDIEALNVYFGITQRQKIINTDSVIEAAGADDKEHKRVYKDHCELSAMNPGTFFVRGVVVEGVQCCVGQLVPSASDDSKVDEDDDALEALEKPFWHSAVMWLGSVMP